MRPLIPDPLSSRAAALRADADVVTLEGLHALKHALRFGAEIELALAADPHALDTLAAALAPDVRERIRELVRPASPAALAVGRSPVPDVVAFARRPQPSPEAVLRERRGRPVIALEDPRHLGNIGAVIRVAAAADAAAVLTTGQRDPWDAAAIRGSAGLHYALPVLAVEAIDTGDRPLVAVDPEGDRLPLSELPSGAVLVFGGERHGLSRATLQRADLQVGIPMRTGVSSLNLATAVAIVLYGIDGQEESRVVPER